MSLEVEPAHDRSPVLWGSLVGLLFVFSWLRGWPGIVETPYWYLSYSSAGFVRRALIGTLTAPFLVGRPIEDGVLFASILCIGTTVAVILWLARGLRLPLSRSRGATVAAVAFAASPALMMLSRDLGFLDIFLVAAAMMLTSYGVVGATIICIAAPLIHEAFFFFAAPILAGIVYLRRDEKWLAPLAALFSTTALIWFGASKSVVWAAGVPISKPGLASFAAWQLGQRAHIIWPHPCLVGAAIAMLSIFASGSAAWRASDWRYGLATMLGGMFTASIMMLGTDADRFVAWAPITSLIMMMLAFRP